MIEQTKENLERFESRKADHIRLALDPRTQAVGGSGLDRVVLSHEAFPELDFSAIDISLEIFKHHFQAPLFISSMTAGHGGSLDLNLVIARVAEKRGWLMGVGSQRRELADPEAAAEWTKIRKLCPNVRFMGNIGLAQLIQISNDDVRRLADSLDASAMIVHTNPLQECLQPEGTPAFKGGLKALEQLCRHLGRPVIVKETGCGFSQATLQRLNGLGLFAVDVSGFGGTHWGRVEGGRSSKGEMRKLAAETFANWGVSTVDSMLASLELKTDYRVWASGGVRSGLDAAKLIALGADLVGFAQPIIEAALQGEEALDRLMALLEFELKTALFCTGSRTMEELRSKKTEVRA